MLRRNAALTPGGAVPPSILLVEDDAALRQALAETLLLTGYTVYDAESGPQALALLNELSTKKVDLVISDLVMRGMNALELYDALRSASYQGPMLVITGYPMPNTGMSLVERPGVQWRSKPIGAVELRDAVSRLLGSLPPIGPSQQS